jgi:transposase
VRHRRFHNPLAACAPAESGPTFDVDHFRADIKAIKAQAVIPSEPIAGAQTTARRAHLQGRHLVECCFNKLKHFGAS